MPPGAVSWRGQFSAGVTRPVAVFEAVAVAFEAEDLGVVHEPVDHHDWFSRAERQDAHVSPPTGQPCIRSSARILAPASARPATRGSRAQRSSGTWSEASADC